MISVGERKLGLIVDALESEEELVIKALDENTVATDLVSGASILGDGRVVLILNLAAVVERSSKPAAKFRRGGIRFAAFPIRQGSPGHAGGGRAIMNDPVRVLVVDDSALMRKLIPQILQTDSSIQVVGTAMDGIFGLKKIEELKPQVVTVDLEMPGMGGLDMLKEIMRRHRIPVIVVSSHSKEGASVTLKALSLGAFDFVAKPVDVAARMPEIAQELISKIKAAAQSRGIRVAPFHGIRPSVTKVRRAWNSRLARGGHRHFHRWPAGVAISAAATSRRFSFQHSDRATHAGRLHRHVRAPPRRNLRHQSKGGAIRRSAARRARLDFPRQPSPQGEAASLERRDCAGRRSQGQRTPALGRRAVPQRGGPSSAARALR